MHAELAGSIVLAESRIRPYIFETPLVASNYLSSINTSSVYLKLENEQVTGSFKIRGATNKILSLSPEEIGRGLVTASSGNHGIAFATAVKLLPAVDAEVFIAHNASSAKVELIRDLKIKIRITGSTCLDAEMQAKNYAAETNKTWISPYNDWQVIAGQGTVGSEIARQIPDADFVLVTIGGGGLISGIAASLQDLLPRCKIIGCLPENSPEMYFGIKEDRYIEPYGMDTISEGSAGGYEPGAVTIGIIKKLVDDFILVSEDEIQSAMRLIYDQHHKVIEGAAGVAVAAFIKKREQFAGKKIVIVICGANIGRDEYKKVL